MSRIPTPNRSQLPSAAPIQSQQAHIDELVQSTRTLETINGKLKDALSAEQTRGREAIQAIQTRWETDKATWGSCIEELHDLHRIAHLRTISQLEGEKLRVLKERDKIRQAKSQTAEAAFKVSALRWRETELMAKVEELEDEIEEVRLEGEENLQGVLEQCQGVVERLKSKCKEFAEETKQKSKELEKVLKEKEKVDVRLSPYLLHMNLYTNAITG
jgi:chromosome segregation ATPase